MTKKLLILAASMILTLLVTETVTQVMGEGPEKGAWKAKEKTEKDNGKSYIRKDIVEGDSGKLNRPTESYNYDPNLVGDTTLESLYFKKFRTLRSKNEVFRITRILLELGADANVRDMRGVPVLHKATLKGNEKAVEELIKHGALVDAKTPSNEEVLFKLRQFELQEDISNPMTIYGVRKRPRDLYERFTQANPFLDLGQDTALHYAVGRHDTEIVKILLKYGADYRIKNLRRKSPWDIAKEGANSSNARSQFWSIADKIENEKILAIFNNHERHTNLIIPIVNILSKHNIKAEIAILDFIGHIKLEPKRKGCITAYGEGDKVQLITEKADEKFILSGLGPGTFPQKKIAAGEGSEIRLKGEFVFNISSSFLHPKVKILVRSDMHDRICLRKTKEGWIHAHGKGQIDLSYGSVFETFQLKVKESSKSSGIP
jgi:ankyrin repeat protein